ncbi:hypothetical protein KY290_024907 [Solanum tuberosum]|uniref:Uncharacterized protein n=1 Tax=Solanum tuberosum TaxID=4113 RepID=A0ABQ7URZ9_SOLTU|nr:hypothetical protein KY284_023759 [Solanum tuberosum]KAH0754637.1 hypothetical protein KY290_024907 [Solanum tuberosum]
MNQQVTPWSIDHLIRAVDDEPNEEMEEDPEEDPREPTEEMEGDLEGYSEHDPNHVSAGAPRSIDHLIQAVDDEPNEEIEEDPEEDPREPTKEMEGDSKGYSEHDPNLYNPRDGRVMHMEDEFVPTVEDAHSEYGFIGFDEKEDSQNWEWKIDESPEYHPEPFYDGDDDSEDAPTRSLADSRYNLRSEGKMTDKDEFNTAANIIVPIKNPKSSRSMIDIQNEEKMARMEQELEILREELLQV